ncbi:MAG: caspase family protein, partial [Betaproteobacteria bacterium]|nr:caspase family protein [Betaproteobacteria bacterium]
MGFSRGEAIAQSRGLGPVFVTGTSADSQGSLNSLPRQALVIGNSRYKETPLRNPASDANAMAGALERIGFDVALLLDAGRDQMRNAIQTYGDSVAKRSAVGLFYFAGHGVQLAWRNYLIPVDAVVDNPDDVRERAVDLNTLLQGLTRAKNPMNVIILDACRDNPFGTRVRTDQKGLSQFDAPPGSMLAYATAPGNTASDGEGENGLYTENLLREMHVPDAKIEDVFKRVRLHVRRRTHGQQIPWESTSLEEDFSFAPSALLAAFAEAAEHERRRQQELAALEKQRLADEAERNRKREAALKEARRAAEEAERRRREEQALLEARRAQEEAERKRQQELALLEKQRAQEEAERRRRQQPAPAAKPDAVLAERQFEEELAIWEKIKTSTEPGPLEDYLLRYPSGRFSELAQLQLDRILATLGEK